MPELTAPVVKTDNEKRLVYGPVLIPDEPDSDGDVVSAEQIEKVAHTFVEDYGNIDLQHSLNNVGALVESYIAPAELSFDSDVSVPKGSWMMGVRVNDDDTWSAVKNGQLTGFSIMGTARAVTKGKEAATKRTTLADLGDDFLVNAVSLVDEPAVPQAKWIAVKSKAKEGQKKETVSQETINKAIQGSIEERKQLVRRAVRSAFDGEQTDSFVHSTTDDAVIVEVMDTANGNEKLVQLNYSIDDNGQVEFTSEPQEVKIEETVVPVDDSNTDPMNVFRSAADSQSKEGIWDKVKKMFGGQTEAEKAGKQISEANYKQLKTAKEVIDNLLQVAENERANKNTGGGDMNKEDVQQIVDEKLKETSDKQQSMDEKMNSIMKALEIEQENAGQGQGQSQGEQGGQGENTEKGQGNQSGQGEQNQNQNQGQGEGGQEDDKHDEILKSLHKNQPLSKRLTGQDTMDNQAEKEKPKKTRDAFGRKIKQ